MANRRLAVADALRRRFRPATIIRPLILGIVLLKLISIAVLAVFQLWGAPLKYPKMLFDALGCLDFGMIWLAVPALWWTSCYLGTLLSRTPRTSFAKFLMLPVWILTAVLVVQTAFIVVNVVQPSQSFYEGWSLPLLATVTVMRWFATLLGILLCTLTALRLGAVRTRLAP